MTDVGTRVRIGYFDQNESFAPMLPRDGVLVRRLRSTKGTDNFFLMRLDAPFNYEGQTQEYFVIRSRWQGCEVGEPAQTSVFVLLVPDSTQLDRDEIDVDKFHHVCWGMATTLVGPAS